MPAGFELVAGDLVLLRCCNLEGIEVSVSLFASNIVLFAVLRLKVKQLRGLD